MQLARAAGLVAAAALGGCAFLHSAGLLPPSGGPDRLALSPATFRELPGWPADHSAEAAAAFARSCARLALAPPDQTLGGEGEAARLGGQAGQWSAVCAAARALPPGDDAAARQFWEAGFQPYAVSNNGQARGLFTGYYEPEVAGSREKTAPDQSPLLARPPDLVQLDLGDFFDDLKGRRTAGRVQDGHLVPYYDRAQIEQGALSGRHLELLYVNDPVDLFFLQIQGAGRVDLPGGGVARVGYAGQNGRPYVPIGKLLADRGEIPSGQVSEQSIRAWLAAHPAQAAATMDQNPSYVFFRELADTPPDQGPPGALGVPLTPVRSIAVDRQFIPLGAPVWIDTTEPSGTPLQRLMVAQDIGGALRG
ncbi:MAG: murein transglycosylase A, partial [Acidisphaera sp.]|nr:murein transglycosylase A [Acidisphaera sp.]